MSWTDWLPATRGQLNDLEKRMNQEVTDLKTKFDAALTAITANLANVTADVANLDSQIQALKDQVATGSLGPDDIAAFNAIADAAGALVTSTANLAALTPDAPPAAPAP